MTSLQRKACLRAKRIFTSWPIWVAVTIVALFVVVAIKITKIANDYDERQYDVSEYTNSVESITPIFEAYECPNTNDKQTCQEKQTMVMEWATSLHTLSAQNVIAKATRGMLYVSAFAAIAAFGTLGFLAWTVHQTALILRETRTATRAATETLNQTIETTSLTRIQLEPYFDVARWELFLARDFNRNHIKLVIFLENFGQSPAIDMMANFSHLEYFHSKNGGNEFNFEGIKYPFDIDTISADRAEQVINPKAIRIFTFNEDATRDNPAINMNMNAKVPDAVWTRDDGLATNSTIRRFCFRLAITYKNRFGNKKEIETVIAVHEDRSEVRIFERKLTTTPTSNSSVK